MGSKGYSVGAHVVFKLAVHLVLREGAAAVRVENERAAAERSPRR